ncbi:MAG: hypothetical protein EPN73_01370 [Paraburkholderia sp.]|uniref:hypothetical protein n=1 Tax=Paraburkholderia sp. TaxID=1926495 RepID=UPI00121CAED9|nr:hypothetical protein [Paraburkholderia sp.]TAL98924.1 MAG: hypothetical protein EPN73_01370 [Paraburkholderia sp.]
MKKGILDFSDDRHWRILPERRRTRHRHVSGDFSDVSYRQNCSMTIQPGWLTREAATGDGVEWGVGSSMVSSTSRGLTRGLPDDLMLNAGSVMPGNRATACLLHSQPAIAGGLPPSIAVLTRMIVSTL